MKEKEYFLNNLYAIIPLLQLNFVFLDTVNTLRLKIFLWAYLKNSFKLLNLVRKSLAQKFYFKKSLETFLRMVK